MAVSEMTAVDFDVFRTRRWQAGAALKGYDSVSFAVDAAGGDGQRLLAADPCRFGERPVASVPRLSSRHTRQAVLASWFPRNGEPRVISERTSSGKARASSRA
jgi:hypothetical protein